MGFFRILNAQLFFNCQNGGFDTSAQSTKLLAHLNKFAQKPLDPCLRRGDVNFSNIKSNIKKVVVIPTNVGIQRLWGLRDVIGKIAVKQSAHCLVLALSVTLTACQPQSASQNPSLKPSSNSPTHQSLNDSQTVKIITPDWGVASTLTAMGYPPIATGDIRTYADWVAEPKLPADTIDLGARFAPNPERLAQLKTQFSAITIIDNDFYAHLRPQYGDIPHVAVSFTPKAEIATWQDYAEPTRKLGEIIHQPEKADQFLAQSKQKLGELGNTFRQKNPTIKKIAVVQFADSNNLRIYTNNSLFKPTLDEMGLTFITLENQLGKGNAWGFLPIGLGDLAKLDNDTCLVVVEPFSPMLRQELDNNLLWQRLGYGKAKCMAVVEPLWTYGGVSSMVTFAERLNGAEFSNVTNF